VELSPVIADAPVRIVLLLFAVGFLFPLGQALAAALESMAPADGRRVLISRRLTCRGVAGRRRGVSSIEASTDFLAG